MWANTVATQSQSLSTSTSSATRVLIPEWISTPSTPSNSQNTCSPALHCYPNMVTSARWQRDLMHTLTHCSTTAIQDISAKLLLPSINTLTNYRSSECNQTNAPVKVFFTKEKNVSSPLPPPPLLSCTPMWGDLRRASYGETVALHLSPPPSFSFSLSFGLITGCQFIIKH